VAAALQGAVVLVSLSWFSRGLGVPSASCKAAAGGRLARGHIYSYSRSPRLVDESYGNTMYHQSVIEPTLYTAIAFRRLLAARGACSSLYSTVAPSGVIADNAQAQSVIVGKVFAEWTKYRAM
jgi:hypothetical protein